MLSLLCVALSSSAAVSAAPEPSEHSERQHGQDIVVTGERLKRRLIDTPSSVEIFDEKRVGREPGADRLDQLLEHTPNVTLGTSSLGPTIRGQDSTGALQDLPAFLGGNRPRVTLQVDGRAVGYNEFVFGVAPLWDVEQVEIFRSPQTTTQGRNSIAGAIIVETLDPGYAPEAAARLIHGNRGTRQLSAMASGPLAADQLAVRISADLRKGRPSSDISDFMIGADPDNDDYGLLRIKLLAEPAALPSLRLETSFVHSESLSPQVDGIRPPFEKRRDPAPAYGVFRTLVDSFTARAALDLTDGLRSNTTFAIGDSSIERHAIRGLGQAQNRVRDWSVDSAVDWRLGRGRLVAGVHHLQTRLDQIIDLSAVLGLGYFDDRQRSTGLFGEYLISPVDSLTLTAGLRYQSDWQHRVGTIGRPGLGFPLDYDERFSAWLPRFSLAYAFHPRATAGLLVQRAYNAGGTSINFDTGHPETFGSERAWSYELFARAAAGRAWLSANLFRTDFRDSQRAQIRAYTVPGGRTAFWAEIKNVPKARSHGAEFSVDWPASDRLRLNGGLGVLRTRITQAAGTFDIIDGKEFQRAPHLTLSGAIDWQLAARIRFNLSARHHSGYFSTDDNNPVLAIEPTTLVNARADYMLRGARIFAYARNLFDRFEMSHLSGPTFGTAVDPREVGIGFERRF